MWIIYFNPDPDGSGPKEGNFTIGMVYYVKGIVSKLRIKFYDNN
jgi:hypothetical protein